MYRGSLLTKLMGRAEANSMATTKNLLAFEVQDLMLNIENILTTRAANIFYGNFNEIANSVLTYGGADVLEQEPIDLNVLPETIQALLYKYEPRLKNLQITLVDPQNNAGFKVNGLLQWEDYCQQIYFEIQLNFASKTINIVGI
jgi:predicted component of type VI protein secretion system